MKIDKLIEQIKGFLFAPKKEFKKVKKSDLVAGIKYAVIGILVFSILSSIIAVLIPNMFSPEVGPFGIIGVFFISFFGGLIGLFLGAVILHVFVYLLGGRKGISETIKALAYAQTPSYYLGWIPVVNIFAGIWTLILEIWGIAELQKMSTGRAALAVLLPIIIMIVLVVVIMGVLFVTLGPELLADSTSPFSLLL